MNDKGLNKTEFIGYIITIVGLILEMIKSTNPETYALIIGVLTGIYIICRTIYKVTSTKIDDIIVEKLEQILKDKKIWF